MTHRSSSSPSALVVWDLDDVLANLRDAVCRTMGPIFGVDADWRSWTAVQPLHRLFGAAPEEFDGAMIAAGVLAACEPEPGAQDILRHFHSAGFRQVIITARGWHPSAEAETWTWLETHSIAGYLDQVVIVPTHGSKSGAINALGQPVDLYVDDMLHHVEAAITHCPVRSAILRDRPWNRTATLPQLVRIGHLAELVDLLPAASSAA